MNTVPPSAASAPALTTAPFDRRTEDVGNIVEFGHLNIRVPDQQQALAFYVTGLGLTRDPYLMTGPRLAWVNVGSSQLHLPVGPAQVARGVIGLVLPDLDALMERLAAASPYLEGSRFSARRQGALVELTCPWGNRLRVHAPDASRFGRMQLGMPYLELDCPAGTAHRIARFYTQVLSGLAQVGDDDTGTFARIPIGLSESLVFRETSQALPPYDGHHVQVTLADFSGAHRRLLERGLVTQESNQSQYRFEDIIDLDSGEVLLQLEHEVRSMRHPLYGRQLVNRDPALTAGSHATGFATGR